MARTSDVRSFDYDALRTTTRSMRERGEAVHDEGRRYRQEHGTLHPHVDVKQNRGSHNAMIPGKEPGTFVLVNGIALPVLSMFDGTGSTAVWLEDFFHAAERQHRLFDGARPRYNTQLASAVVQDVVDPTPVVQLSQFETDERSAEQVRLLQPAGGGGDLTEDYDLGLAAGLYVYADLWTYYGLKGYFTLTADDRGRGFITKDGVLEHLGQDLGQSGRLETLEICRRLLEHWHLFLLQVPDSSRKLLSYSTNWWNEKLGTGRIIQVGNPSLLAEVRAGLVYVTEATHPTKQGLIEFLGAGNQELKIDAHDLDKVWSMLQAAEQHFSAQVNLSGFQDIPRPGDVFANYRHAWPIGHPRASENATPVETTSS